MHFIRHWRHSVLPTSKGECNIKGVSRNPDTKKFFEPLTCEIGSKQLSHSFYYDLLSKLGATIRLSQEQVKILIPNDKGMDFMSLLHHIPKDQ